MICKVNNYVCVSVTAAILVFGCTHQLLCLHDHTQHDVCGEQVVTTTTKKIKNTIAAYRGDLDSVKQKEVLCESCKV